MSAAVLLLEISYTRIISFKLYYVAWGWAINGFFSVIGSTLTTIVSMAYGFRIVLFASVALYLVAVVLLARLQRRNVTAPDVVERPETAEVLASAV